MGLTHTVSGDVAHFRTPSRVPIDSLKFHFLPKQASGTPSPENPIPIEGWTGLNGRRSGKNLFSNYGLIYGKWVLGTGEVQDTIRGALTKEIPVSSGEVYSFSFNGSSYLPYSIEVVEYNKDKEFLRRNYSTRSEITAPPSNITFTVGSNTKYIVCAVFSTEDSAINQEKVESYKMQLERGSVSSYEPYSGEQIPITFPTTGKNKFLYNEDNIELGLPTEAGLIRTVVHTGVYGNGENISISATAIDPEMVSNNSFNVGYIKDGVIHVLKSFISWIDGSVTNGTVIVPSGYEFVIIATTDSKWAVTRNIPRYNIQIEYSDAPTTYEPYSSDNTFYGGYIDPVAGEISENFTYIKIKDLSWVYNTSLGRFATSRFQNASRLRKVICDSYKTLSPTGSESEYQSRDSVIYAYGLVSETGYFVIHLRDSRFDNVEDFVSAMGEHYICYESVSPKILPISPQTMKAFLDHNNFWSDANDITEVSYEVTESKDIQAARKRFEAEEDGHHKLVKWNQLVHDGNFTDVNLWYVNRNYGSISASNNVMTWTCTTHPTQYYHTGFMRDSTRYCAIPWNHKVLVRAVVRCSIPTLFNLYALVGNGGNTHTYFYRNNIPANEWTELIGFIRDRPETPPSGVDDLTIVRFKACITGTNSQISTVEVGTIFDVKDFVAFDLTQMFGLGNEPSTVAEFERICALNGIDLTTYQPYDTGSDRWLIVP